MLNPFLNMSMKFVTASIAPAMIDPTPAMTVPKVAKNSPIVETAELINDPIFVITDPAVVASPLSFVPKAASLGNSNAITSPRVSAPPFQRANPSTAFPTTPTIPETPPLNVFRIEKRLLTDPTTSLATFSAAIDAAMVPIAFPIASMVAGSWLSITEKISPIRSTTPCTIYPAVSKNPWKNPSSKAETPGNSSLSPWQNPTTKSFAAWIINGKFV